MAVCKYCGKEMLTAKGCSISKVYINGKKYKRIKAGAPEDIRRICKEGGRCPDCGATKGHYHHWECDGETCPVCHEQLLVCSCEKVQIRYIPPKRIKVHYFTPLPDYIYGDTEEDK